MRKQTFQIDKMPFFERFEGKDKAVIFMDAFEKWLKENDYSKSKDKPDKKRIDITEHLNRVYQTESSLLDSDILKMQISSIENGDW